MTAITDAKVITFNRITRDYDATFDGQYVGSFPNFVAAEDALNDHALRLIEDGLVDRPLALLDAEPNPLPAPEPDDLDVGNDPAPGRCPHCHDDGRACWDCGHLDTPSIGRKLVYLQHNDRPTLIQILRGTQRQFWPLLAQAYVAALGATEAGQTVPALGVVGLWELLTNEATAAIA